MIYLYIYIYNVYMFAHDPGTIKRSSGTAFLDAHKEDDPTLGEFYATYSFLFLGYNVENFHWEVFVISRKALISLIGVSLATEQRLQGMLGMLIIFVFTVLHAYQSPFCEPWLNHFEFLSLLTSASTFYLGVTITYINIPMYIMYSILVFFRFLY